MMTSLTPRRSGWRWCSRLHLPVFLLGLPSGALADIRRPPALLHGHAVLGGRHGGRAVRGIALDLMTAPLLLALTFANGIGLAMRWPVFAAIVPELVPRRSCRRRSALNGIAMNASRIIGPLMAGADRRARAPSGCSRSTRCCRSSPARDLRWRREHTPNPLGREPLASAMRVGVQFVRQSQRMRAVLLRIACSSCIRPPCWRCCRWWRAPARRRCGHLHVLLAAMGVGRHRRGC
jgi:hypothetical protein